MKQTSYYIKQSEVDRLRAIEAAALAQLAASQAHDGSGAAQTRWINACHHTEDVVSKSLEVKG